MEVSGLVHCMLPRSCSPGWWDSPLAGLLPSEAWDIHFSVYTSACRRHPEVPVGQRRCLPAVHVRPLLPICEALWVACAIAAAFLQFM